MQRSIQDAAAPRPGPLTLRICASRCRSTRRAVVFAAVVGATALDEQRARSPRVGSLSQCAICASGVLGTRDGCHSSHATAHESAHRAAGPFLRVAFRAGGGRLRDEDRCAIHRETECRRLARRSGRGRPVIPNWPPDRATELVPSRASWPSSPARGRSDGHSRLRAGSPRPCAGDRAGSVEGTVLQGRTWPPLKMSAQNAVGQIAVGAPVTRWAVRIPVMRVITASLKRSQMAS
jgi:hypothetical protein